MKRKALLATATAILLQLATASHAELKLHVHEPSSGSQRPGSSHDQSQSEPSQSPADPPPRKEDDDSEGPEKSIHRYGVGDTTGSKESYQSRSYRRRTFEDETGTAAVDFEKRTNETRSRTYEERGLLRYKTGAQAQASLVRVELNTQYESPAATLGGQEVARVRTESSTGAFVGAQADAEAGFDLSPSDPRLEARAGVFVGARVDHRSRAEVDVLGASASTTAEGSASVGVGANANASLSKEGGKAQVGGFAGARAEGSLAGEVGGVGSEARGEAWAGVGAEADAEATFEDGKLTLGGDVGAGLLVGGKVGYTTTVDGRKVHRDGTALVKNGGKLIESNVSKVDVPTLQLKPLAPVTLNNPTLSMTQIKGRTNLLPQPGRARQPINPYRRVSKGVSAVSESSQQQFQDRWVRSTKIAKPVGTRLERGTKKVTNELGRSTSKVTDRVGDTAKKSGKSIKRAGKKASKKVKKISKSLNPFR